jgi:hypothetical protein
MTVLKTGGRLVNKILRPLGLELGRSHQANKRSYHHNHRLRAIRLLASLKEQGKKLTKSLADQCDEYASTVLGGAEFAPWLYVYAANQQRFCDGWIPDNYYGQIVAPRLKGFYGSVSFPVK